MCLGCDFYAIRPIYSQIGDHAGIDRPIASVEIIVRRRIGRVAQPYEQTCITRLPMPCVVVQPALVVDIKVKTGYRAAVVDARDAAQ